jgi:hypothetical protein
VYGKLPAMVTATDIQAQISEDEDGPGWSSRWIRSDPVRTVALGVIIVNVIWRAYIGSRGFMAHDDFFLAIKAYEAKQPTLGFMLGQFNNHLMPLPKLYMWWVTHTIGYAYWPYLAAMIVGQFILGVTFFRLLRLVIPANWGLLIPLCILLFSPLNLETTSWWVFGMYMLPMELAMVWAIGAQVKFARTRHKRHLISLLAAFVFGLLFAEKTMLIIPLLFGVTACFLVKGSTGRSIWRALTRFWPTWAVLVPSGLAFFWLYRENTPPIVPKADSFDQVMSFYVQIFRETLLPGLIGGPWTFLFGGTGPPLASPNSSLHWVAVIGVLAFMAFTVWRRPPAGRAWILFFGYAFVAATLIATTRLGQALSSLAGLVSRYTSDMVVVAALCVGVALFGMRDIPDRRPPRRIAWFATGMGQKVAWAAGGLVAIVLAYGTIVTTSMFSYGWSIQPGRDFLAVSQAELANVPPGTVFIDMPVSGDVMAAYYFPYNMHSKFFLVPRWKPVFVSGAENPKVLDDKGHIRPAWVEKVRQAMPGPKPECGYPFRGPQTITVPLDGPMYPWPWAFRIAYVSDGETPMTVRFGQKTYEFTAQRGLHQYFFGIEGGGDSVDVTVSQSGVNVCVPEITVGKFVPWLL